MIYSDAEVFGAQPATASPRKLSDEEVFGAPSPLTRSEARLRDKLNITQSILAPKLGETKRGSGGSVWQYRGGKPHAPESWARIESETDRIGREVDAYNKEVPFLQRLRDDFGVGYGLVEQGGNVLSALASAAQADYAKNTTDPLSPERRAAIAEKADQGLQQSAKDITQQSQFMAEQPRSPITREIGEAESFGDAFGRAMQDPVGAVTGFGAQSAIISAPALAFGPLGPVAAALGIGGSSATIEGTLGFLENIQEELGPQANDPQAVLGKLRDPEVINRASKAGIGRGAIIGAVDALTAGIASKTLTPGKPVLDGVIQMLAQMAGGGGGEALAQIYEKGEITKPGEVVAEIAGEGVTAPFELAAIGMGARKDKPAAPPPAPVADPAAEPTVDELIGEATAEPVEGEPTELEVETIEAAPPPPDDRSGPAIAAEELQTALDQAPPPANIDVKFADWPVEVVEPAPLAEEEPAPEKPASNVTVRETFLESIPAAPAPLQAMLPPPQKTGVFRVDSQGNARELTQAELQIAQRRERGREDLVRVPSGFTKGIDVPKNMAIDDKAVARTVDTAAHEAATSPLNDRPEPTEAQKEEGNYKKGHVRVAGLDVAIENPAGSRRQPKWPELKSHYGYFKRTEGKDGDQVDVFIKPGTADDWTGPVFVVDQVNKDGTLDEHKVMLGFRSEKAARAGYLENYTKGWKGLGGITEMTQDEFQAWLADGKRTKKPAAAAPSSAADNRAEMARLRALAASQRHKKESVIDPKKDDLLAAIAKAGGISREAATAAGIDPAEFNRRGWKIKRVFTTNGRSLEGMSEYLSDLRYPVSNEHGYGENPMLEALGNALRGQAMTSETYEPLLDDAEYAALTEVGQEQILDAAERAREAGVPEEDIETIVELAATQGYSNEEAIRLLEEEASQRGRDASPARAAGEPEEGSRPETTSPADTRGTEDFAVDGYTEADLAAREQQKKDAEKARQQQELRAQADDQRDSFSLTGSDRVADEAAAAGQQDLLAPVAPKFQTADDETYFKGDKARYTGKTETVAGKTFHEVEMLEGSEKGKAKLVANAPAASVAAKPEVGKIEDFGEKIAGARKEYAAAYADKMKEALGADIASAPLSQSWPEPDYQQLLDEGADPWTVAFVHAARDEIPTKPKKAWKLKGWVQQVELLRKFSDDLLTGNISVERMREELRKAKYFTLARELGGRIELYEAVGHAKSLRGVRVVEGKYQLYEGKKYDPPKVIWTVEQQAKATAFSNWPRTLASADTREAAIEAFKKRISTLDVNPPASRQVSFEIYSRRTDPKKAIIGKKIGKNHVDLKTFDSVKEAREYLKDHQAELEQLLAKHKEIPSERKESNSPRVGADHRNGADVTPEQFQDAFGFRGVQFGNYVEGNRRQQDLNNAYDALLDMAGVLGIPPRSLSLNGELGLAFGARGKGGKGAGGGSASAHYERGEIVINLTKGAGAGSLAHEWWHSLDNYFSRLRGERDQFLTERPRLKFPGDDSIRPEMVEAFAKVARAVNHAALLQRSKKLDGSRIKAYWSTGTEMTARAFEAYVIGKLQDQNQSNDYLANIVSEDYWNAATALLLEKEGTYPYPTADEIPAIRAAYDEFFQTIESKETDTGTMLFARNNRDTYRWLSVTDTANGPLFVGEKLTLWPASKFPNTFKTTGYHVLDENDRRIGVVTLRVEDGKITDLYWLHNETGSKGFGTSVMAALAANSDTIAIHSILPDARGFWDKVGAYDYVGDEKPDATLDWDAFSRAADVRGLGRGTSETADAGAQGSPRSDRSSPEQVQTYLTDRLGPGVQRLVDAGTLVITTSEDTTLPPDAKRAISTGTVHGFTHKGKVYLIADALSAGQTVAGLEDAYAILLHELGVHHGLRQMLGDTLFDELSQQVMQASRSKTNNALARAAKQARAQVPSSTNPDHVAEETMAWLVTDRANHDLPLVKRIIAKIRAFLIRMGFTRAISPDALVELAKGAAMRSAERDVGTKFARSEDTDSIAPEAEKSRQNLKDRALTIVNWLDAKTKPLATLAGRTDYLKDRYLTLGRIAETQRVARSIYDIFRKASKADGEALYAYLTDTEGTLDTVSDPALKKEAAKAKALIDKTGQALVEAGVIPVESFEAYQGRYLPRVYLAYLLGDRAVAAVGTGKTLSSQGYAKKRNETLPQEYRDVILGEIKDPAFLASRALGIPLRDLAILNWLSRIAENADWALPGQTVGWTAPGMTKARKVTPFWLKAEASKLRERAAYYQGDHQKQAMDAAKTMDELADSTLAAAGISAEEVPQGYAKVPNTARYGAIRGLVVRREIYDDIVGVGRILGDEAGIAEKILGYGGWGTKATQLWKWAKVAANPPAQIRNIVSNLVLLNLSGVPMHKIPGYMRRAAMEVRTKGPFYKIGVKYGVTESTFAAQELMRIENEVTDMLVRQRDGFSLLTLKTLAGKIIDVTGDAYQMAETLGKIMKIMDAVEREGKSEADAALEAQEWLFDYSLVGRNTRYLRNAPIGFPFLTFTLKVLPRLLEVAITAPWRYLPYLALFYGAGLIAQLMTGADDDDMDALKKALPEWLREKGHAVMIPVKDEHGRWQYADLGYFMPWSFYTETLTKIGRTAKDLATTGESSHLGDLVMANGLFGGPLPDLLAAIKTGRDSFTKKEIVRESSTGSEKLHAWITYLYGMAAPGWLVGIPPFHDHSTYRGAAGHLYEALAGVTDKRGEPRSTLPQALARFAGINIYPIEPLKQRQQTIRYMKWQISEVKRAQSAIMKDRSLSRDERKAMAEKYREKLIRMQKDLQTFARESVVSAKLR